MYYLQLLTPEEVIFDGEVAALVAPGKEGYLGILTNHASLITSLKAGVLIITEQSFKKMFYKISAGFLEVNNNRVSILVKSIQPTDPVDIGTSGGI